MFVCIFIDIFIYLYIYLYIYLLYNNTYHNINKNIYIYNFFLKNIFLLFKICNNDSKNFNDNYSNL